MASTLDVTPTVLYAMGIPVAKDMAGRPLTGVIDAADPEWVASHGVTGSRAPVAPAPAASDPEMLERLKDLGYIR